jgi:hypothetical chaperone protein
MHAHANAASSCGLDFGTSNSTLGIASGGKARLLPLEGEDLAVPSAIFFGTELENEFLIGRAAIAAYVDGSPGRLMRSLKSILGTTLVDEKTQVHRRRIAFSEVIAMYVSALKRRAEKFLDRELDSVVHGRPVHFVDDDTEADRKAEAALREIALAAGFRDVSFQYEPIAAARDFETRIDREQIAFVADIGGGTSDFTIVRLGPASIGRSDRKSDILATAGIRLGGTDYDRQLSLDFIMPLLGMGSLQKRGDIDVPSGPYWDMSTWSRIHYFYEPGSLAALRYTRQTAMLPHLLERLIRVVEQRRGHSALMSAEEAKIDLSQDEVAHSDLSWIEEGLSATPTRAAFDRSTSRLSRRLTDAASLCVSKAGLDSADIATVFFTGGTSSMPSVRHAIGSVFPDAKMVDGDRFGSVGLGLSIEAALRYG